MLIIALTNSFVIFNTQLCFEDIVEGGLIFVITNLWFIVSMSLAYANKIILFYRKRKKQEWPFVPHRYHRLNTTDWKYFQQLNVHEAGMRVVA